jgi:hypothetical protein
LSSNSFTGDYRKLSRVLAEREVHRLQVGNLGSNLGFVLFYLAWLRTSVNFRLGFLKSFLVNEVSFNVFVEALTSELFGVVCCRLAIVLNQVG